MGLLFAAVLVAAIVLASSNTSTCGERHRRRIGATGWSWRDSGPTVEVAGAAHCATENALTAAQAEKPPAGLGSTALLCPSGTEPSSRPRLIPGATVSSTVATGGREPAFFRDTPLSPDSLREQ